MVLHLYSQFYLTTSFNSQYTMRHEGNKTPTSSRKNRIFFLIADDNSPDITFVILNLADLEKRKKNKKKPAVVEREEKKSKFCHNLKEEIYI
jgi:hypothetical protein